MAATIVEYARFVEVRERRARIAEAFTQPPPEASAAVSASVPGGETGVEAAVPHTDATTTGRALDVH